MSLTPTRLFVNALLLIGSVACSRENLLTLPAPAPSIAGTYVGKSGYFPLPIPGDSVRVILTGVATDTVDVMMQAISKGKLTITVPYGKRPVVQDFSVGACVSYVIRLNPGQDATILYMTCDNPNVLQYADSQRPYFIGASAQFIKR